nr:class I SAM-dependent methyltransferase [Nocardioides convexus]
MENAGLEVQHHENFRLHYAKTLAGWSKNLADNWDACVAETDEGTARVWGLYMAGSRIAFERNEIQAAPRAGDQDGRRRERLPAAPRLLSQNFRHSPPRSSSACHSDRRGRSVVRRSYVVA